MSTHQNVELPVLLEHQARAADGYTTIFDQSNLTKSQFLIWTGQKLNPHAPLYNMALAFVIHGAIDQEVFHKAFELMVGQTDAMRTVIEENDGVPQQRVIDELPLRTQWVDLSSAGDPESDYETWLDERRSRVLSLDTCLYDSVLLKLGEQKYVWYLNQHHLITDGWATALVYRRMADIYQGVRQVGLADQEPAAALPQYSEYRRYEREYRKTTQYQKAEEYWKHKLADRVDPFVFYGRSEPAARSDTLRVPCDLGQERTDRLKAIAQEKGVRSLTEDLSLFNVFMTVLFATLSRVGNSKSLVVGTPSHNRPTPAFKETVGLFIEIQPMRVDVEEDDTFETLLKKVASETFELLRHAQPGSSDFAHNNAYSVLLNYIHASFPSFDGIPIESQWVHNGHGDRNHSLRLQVHDFDDRGSYLLHFDLNCDVFGAQQRTDIIDHYIRTLDAFIEDRTQVVDRVDLLSPQVRDQIVVQYNQSQADYPEKLTVVDHFMKQAVDTPANIAVSQGDRKLTYAELDVRSNKLANYLNRLGVSRGDYVGIHMGRSIDVVVALLGVLKAGAVYVPMDLYYSEHRVAFVLEDTRAKVVLAEAGSSKNITCSDVQVVCLDEDWPAIDECRGEAAERFPCPDDTAYVIYTSGSTGQPKGVMVAHKSLANYIWLAYQSYVGAESLDFPLFTSISFDLTITSIYVPLISGNRVVVYPEDGDKADMAFMRVIEDDQVGLIKLTPSHLSLLNYIDKRPKKLKKLILGGEDLKCSLAGSISEILDGRVEIFNEYGPTEATVGCMIHRFDPGVDIEGSVPIGRPADNMQIYLLDRHMATTAIGIEGEIYIGGIGVAQGYLNRPDLNKHHFVNDPFCLGNKLYRTGDIARWVSPGRLVYVGRKDGQVKIRGARIELGEVESAMLSHEGIEACVVDVVESGRAEDPEKITHCVRCGLPSNFPRLTMSQDGLCSICLEYDAYREQAGMYFKTMDELREALDRAKDRKEGEHDCLMLLSGGKDSTYALYQVVEMGYRPLVFSLDNGYISDGAKDNIRRAVDGLGLELVWGSTESMNEIFADSLARHSNVCQGCFKTIYTLSTNLAKERGIKAIVTGLSRGQVFETRIADLFHEKVFNPKSIDQTIVEARKAYHRMDDAVSRCLDVEVFKDDAVYDDIEFLDYYRYSNVELDQMLSFLNDRAPWVRPSDTGRSTNCLINEAGIYVHKKERGYHNYALPYSWDVRLGHKQRDAALEELDDQIDEDNVNRILKEVGYTPVVRGDTEPTKQLVGYYVVNRSQTSQQVRDYLGLKLTEHMMPSKLIQVDQIPLNDRGKVDRKALAEMYANSAEVESVYVAPRNDVERVLVEIWQHAMKIDRVGIHDNFFDLGGDSILNIQIIARANQAGISLSPNHLFENPTVASLASVAGADSMFSQDQGPVEGDVPMTSMQHWFFEQPLSNYHHWNQVLRIHVNKELKYAYLQKAYQAVTEHHDSFRLSYIQEGGAWRQHLNTIIPAEIQHLDLSSIPDEQLEQAIAKCESDLHSGLELSSGKVVAAALLDPGHGRQRRLLILAHHLIIDALSWQIVLEDLNTAYMQVSQGQSIKLPDKTTSYRKWSVELSSCMTGQDMLQEAKLWASQLSQESKSLPCDIVNKSNTEASTGCITTYLDHEDTTKLIDRTSHAYRTHVYEILVTAYARWVAGITESDRIWVELESHGREELAKDINLLRTVGWFANLYPMALQIDRHSDVGATIKAVKEQMRQVPRGGIGYGVLRYHNDPGDTNCDLKNSERPEVLFSYGGQFDLSKLDVNELGVVQPLLASRAAENIRPHVLEIAAVIDQGRLRMDWRYSRNIHHEVTIQQWANQLLACIQEMIKHCLTSDVCGQHTPSDFPMAKLNADKLSKISSLLRDSDK